MSVTELLFDSAPGAPNVVTFAVRVFPETESVLISLSPDDPRPARCDGSLTYVTMVTDAGRIFVERLSKSSWFEITIVASESLHAVDAADDVPRTIEFPKKIKEKAMRTPLEAPTGFVRRRSMVSGQ
jgi:hypothetical protein